MYKIASVDLADKQDIFVALKDKRWKRMEQCSTAAGVAKRDDGLSWQGEPTSSLRVAVRQSAP